MRACWLGMGVGILVLSGVGCAEGGALGEEADDLEVLDDAAPPLESSSSSSSSGSATPPRPSSSSGEATGSSSGDDGNGASSSSGEPAGGSSSGGGGGSSSGGTGCTDRLLINEVMAEGSKASDEFVEIYNPNTCAVDFGTLYKLVYRSSGDNVGVARSNVTGALSVPAGGYIVLGSPDYTGPKQGALIAGLSKASGQVAIVRKSNDQTIDGVAWGNVVNGSFTEQQPANSAASGQSIARMPNGTDTNHNRNDFQVRTPSPGVAN